MLRRKKFIFPLSFLATTNDIIWVCKWQLWQQLSLKLWSYLRGANNRWWNWKVVALLNSLQGIGRFSIKSMKQDISGPFWRDNKANITLWDVTKYFLESTLISDRPDSNLLAELITLWDVTKYFLESTLISDRPDSNLLAELKEVP